MSQEQSFRPRNEFLCTFAISLGVFMQVLDSTIANVSLPTIAGNLGVSLNQGTWVITSFTMSNAIGLTLTAWLSRRIGNVKLYAGSLILFVAMSFMCGIAHSMTELVIFRTLQGLSSAPLFPISQVLLLCIFPKEKRSMALSILGLVAVVGPIVGPIAGGWLTYNYSWPLIFFINVPIGIFTIAVVLSQLKGLPHVPEKSRFDVIGFASLALGVGVLQIVLDKGNELDWFSNHWIVAGSVIAAISLIFMVIWELTDDHPVINLRLFSNRNFCLGTILLTLGFAGFFSINLIVPQWLQRQMGYTSLWAGLAASPMGILPVLLSPLLGAFRTKLDMRILTIISFIVIGGSCYMRSCFNLDVDFTTVALVQFFMGFGIALFFMPVTTILLSELSEADAADAASLSTFIRTIGASFASSLSTWIWTRNAGVHHSVLAEQVNIYNPLASFVTHSDSTNPLSYINQIITLQSYMLSTIDLFHILMWMFIFLVPCIFFTRKAGTGFV
ncbi:DHA2 family efflux MFS transporter permease subunit [Vibrio mangrovi]|uniref:DHA2 family efflux MFS transporter permease subunit n=1 Tax=Vibrio mangrovi TaxID=474394 RepID=A0A1Y6J0Y8_9VIBR|nr:DHA2 family efflux MFS transporter permease subunit [Vibrio mangrovi]MDW6002903.1 DHA2 family efflux MFS transporter permease subunit [Vibrio mangrovi]SMS02392.1 Multidrug export protein EmrB [Vibrio mangrovi]